MIHVMKGNLIKKVKRELGKKNHLDHTEPPPPRVNYLIAGMCVGVLDRQPTNGSTRGR
jgi:hypothetical protein